ncbi:protein FAF-like, chloroplastic [Malania oleifera]|uniref:protein FAF-like, chloroplastic n=1 Tax=Malania oleifera TaxID=397392 RepID=UPI0025ADE5D8|nr:protein FAF-like, chloroplastic [Malania oleifera]
MSTRDSLCKSLPFSAFPLKRIEEEGAAAGAILASSLRTTLSADISSKKWLAQNGLASSPVKKSASSGDFTRVFLVDSSSSSSEGEEEYDETEYEETEEFITKQEEEDNDDERPGQFDVWNSILAKKAEDSSKSEPLPPPYVHPLDKRSSSMSEKSLEICTESLGSENGSEGFFPCPPWEMENTEEDKKEEKQEKESQFFEAEEARVEKCKNSQTPSFPPPLPSLFPDSNRSSLCMRPHRENGRLVLEAVPSPSQNCMHIHRQDGRLLLGFAGTTPPENQNINEEEEEEGEEEAAEEIKKEHGELDMGIAMGETPKLVSGVINVPILMKELSSTSTKSGSTPESREVVSFEEDAIAPLPKSLPPRTRVARLIAPPPAAVAAASLFITYEYCWEGPFAHQYYSPIKNNSSNTLIITTSPNAQQHRQLLLLSGNVNIADYIITLFKGFKSHGKPLPCCIATS